MPKVILNANSVTAESRERTRVEEPHALSAAVVRASPRAIG